MFILEVQSALGFLSKLTSLLKIKFSPSKTLTRYIIYVYIYRRIHQYLGMLIFRAIVDTD